MICIICNLLLFKQFLEIGSFLYLSHFRKQNIFSWIKIILNRKFIDTESCIHFSVCYFSFTGSCFLWTVRNLSETDKIRVVIFYILSVKFIQNSYEFTEILLFSTKVCCLFNTFYTGLLILLLLFINQICNTPCYIYFNWLFISIAVPNYSILVASMSHKKFSIIPIIFNNHRSRHFLKFNFTSYLFTIFKHTH